MFPLHLISLLVTLSLPSCASDLAFADLCTFVYYIYLLTRKLPISDRNPSNIVICRCRVCRSIYSGHQSILIPPGEVESNPALWLTVVSQEKGSRVLTFCICC